MREQLNRGAWWLLSDTAREQVWAQNRTDEKFEWDCNQAKLLGFTVSPIKRSLRETTDKDGKPSMCQYHVWAIIDGPEQEMQHLTDILYNKYPPVYADLLRAKR